ncbi:hypothetical protein TSAR_012338 [Trichomalopsis sarcophagae]|uniref:Uncharacterized protein n=1 Tax=Trichomalopsis sarcophagae TaxID=543379 RepID=A0A232EME5_9HYME|nr:hypothetical protein TSAR_012338 [Trichomalopsis sarcophagae]
MSIAVQGDVRPMRIYRIPLQTLSRTSVGNCSQRRCLSRAEPKINSAPPLTAGVSPEVGNTSHFLSAEPQQHRMLSRSCSSSPTPSLGASISSSSSNFVVATKPTMLDDLYQRHEFYKLIESLELLLSNFAWLDRTQTVGQAGGPRSVQVSGSSESDECPQRSHPSDLGGKTLVSLTRPKGKG